MSYKIMIEAITIGFLIALPVGPIGVLCINRSIAGGFRSGLITGLGAASADAIYGLIAVLGITTITTFLIGAGGYIKLIGGVLLCYLAINILIDINKKNNRAKAKQYSSYYISSLILTLTNPATIIAFTAIFAALGLGYQYKGITSAILMVTGVFIGSLLWWIILSGGVSVFRKKINDRFRQFIGLISGSLIFIFGLSCIISTIR